MSLRGFLSYFTCSLQWTVWRLSCLTICFTFVAMADEELPYEHQLDKIASHVNKYRADDILLESFLTPTFLKYFPVVMETGVLPGLKWNNISGLFVWSPVLPMTYVNRDVLLAMSKQHIWDAATPEGYHPQRSLAIVKLYPTTRCTR